MAWYVFAFVDRPPAERQGRGLAGALAARRVPGGFAIVERRADVPPVELGALRKHDAVVTRVAEAVPAILPVRFGTLLEMDQIEEALEDREAEIAEAFDRVRGRVQFTWRRPRSEVRDPRSEVRRPRSEVGGPTSEVEGPESAVRRATGTEYLQRAARAATASSAAFRTIRDRLGPLVDAERYQPATSTLPDSLYHLVERRNKARYRLVAEQLAAAGPALRVTGPFPPFAFTPEWL
jgi:hypothetical protein